MYRSMLAFCVLLLALGACKSSQTTSPPANTSASTTEIGTAAGSPAAASPGTTPVVNVKPKIDACALLSSKDIEAVQGEAVKETKLSGQAGGGLQVSQCFYTLPSFANSISLLVAHKGEGPDAKDPKEFWRETFQKESGEERERERERERGRDRKDRDKAKPESGRGEEEEEEGVPPQKVSGVGDSAYWIGSRVGGALYVLKGNAYLRISVGGSGDQASGITKTKKLAQKAVARL